MEQFILKIQPQEFHHLSSIKKIVFNLFVMGELDCLGTPTAWEVEAIMARSMGGKVDLEKIVGDCQVQIISLQNLVQMLHIEIAASRDEVLEMKYCRWLCFAVS